MRKHRVWWRTLRFANLPLNGRSYDELGQYGQAIFSSLQAFLSGTVTGSRGLQPAGSPANWLCIVLEKLGRVKLLDDGWHTAPNHSRPASRVTDADIDAEDYPERDPQKGH